jgi:hypothetical protein
MGDTKGGPFEITADVAASMVSSPNPDGRSNAEVVKRWANGLDIGGRSRDMYIIDFGVDMTGMEAAQFEAPFEYLRSAVQPSRTANRRPAYAERWWLHVEPRSGMRRALHGLPRFIATIRHSKHRLFVWFDSTVLPDSALIAFARDDDYTIGVLHSRLHEAWARGTGTQLREVESGFRYTPTTCFETFPFPRPTDDQRETIAAAARELVRLRDGWLNPPGMAPEELAVRTLTNLYNQRPSWLTNAHAALDRAVFDAYGWPADLLDADLLGRLLDLNLSREPA